MWMDTAVLKDIFFNTEFTILMKIFKMQHNMDYWENGYLDQCFSNFFQVGTTLKINLIFIGIK